MSCGEEIYETILKARLVVLVDEESERLQEVVRSCPDRIRDCLRSRRMPDLRFRRTGEIPMIAL